MGDGLRALPTPPACETTGHLTEVQLLDAYRHWPLIPTETLVGIVDNLHSGLNLEELESARGLIDRSDQELRTRAKILPSKRADFGLSPLINGMWPKQS